MSIYSNELFQSGLNPSLWYLGYDEPWILKPAPPPEKKPEPEVKKPEKGVIELRMPLSCEGCKDRVSKHLKEIDGVNSVDCDLMKQKVVVKGDVKPEKVLQMAKQISKRAEFWDSKEKK
ncbi:hypothetical protein R1sor_011847 [Riccia sorocarpa]|uniref:HMA domain-containing protein n=1 Tax=Riccia sorocarpa TaxID=122646 RepID=A0ABD3I3C8_9MARC